DHGHEGQLPADDDHGNDAGDEGDDVGQDRRGGTGDHRFDPAHVVLQAGLDLAGLRVREEGERQSLQVRVQPVAQVPHDLLPDPGGLVGLHDADGPVDDRYQGHDAHQHVEQVQVGAA